MTEWPLDSRIALGVGAYNSLLDSLYRAHERIQELDARLTRLEKKLELLLNGGAKRFSRPR